MHIKQIFIAIVPYYGKGARLRFFLRVREFLRKHHSIFLGSCLKNYIQSKYGMELSIKAVVHPQTMFMHTVGVVIGEGCVVEKGVKIYSGVTLGRKDINEQSYPTIKKGAILCTKCSVLGNIVVGENAIIGAHSLVLEDCKPGGLYCGTPAKLIK